MKIELTLEKLNNAINRVQKVSAKNISLPILENVLLIAKDNSLLLRATNLHVGVEITLPVKVESEGEVAIKLDLFSSIVNSLKKNHKIVLETKENILTITADKSEMEINTYESSDFPTLPQVSEGVDFVIPVEKFIEGVRSVAYAASVSDIKPEISSVYIHSVDNELVFVATDSFRLAEKRMVVSGAQDFPGVIIPIKNIQECIKVFHGTEGDVVCTLGKNQISLQNNEIYFTSRIVDGNYPDYKQIIPTEEKTSLIVLRDDLLSSLKLVNVFSDNFNQISLVTQKDQAKVTFRSRNTEVGENSTDIDAVLEGEDIEMFLNHRYLTDVFQVLSDDSVYFSFTEKNRPFLVRAVGENSFLYLIMPMNR